MRSLAWQGTPIFLLPTYDAGSPEHTPAPPQSPAPSRPRPIASSAPPRPAGRESGGNSPADGYFSYLAAASGVRFIPLSQAKAHLSLGNYSLPPYLAAQVADAMEAALVEMGRWRPPRGRPAPAAGRGGGGATAAHAPDGGGEGEGGNRFGFSIASFLLPFISGPPPSVKPPPARLPPPAPPSPTPSPPPLPPPNPSQLPAARAGAPPSARPPVSAPVSPPVPVLPASQAGARAFTGLSALESALEQPFGRGFRLVLPESLGASSAAGADGDDAGARATTAATAATAAAASGAREGGDVMTFYVPSLGGERISIHATTRKTALPRRLPQPLPPPAPPHTPPPRISAPVANRSPATRSEPIDRELRDDAAAAADNDDDDDDDDDDDEADDGSSRHTNADDRCARDGEGCRRAGSYARSVKEAASGAQDEPVVQVGVLPTGERAVESSSVASSVAGQSGNGSEAQALHDFGEYARYCQPWARLHECEENPTFMLEQCAASCRDEARLPHSLAQILAQTSEHSGLSLSEEEIAALIELAPRTNSHVRAIIKRSASPAVWVSSDSGLSDLLHGSRLAMRPTTRNGGRPVGREATATPQAGDNSPSAAAPAPLAATGWPPEETPRYGAAGRSNGTSDALAQLASKAYQLVDELGSVFVQMPPPAKASVVSQLLKRLEGKELSEELAKMGVQPPEELAKMGMQPPEELAKAPVGKRQSRQGSQPRATGKKGSKKKSQRTQAT